MTNQRNKVTVNENVVNVLTVETLGIQGPAFAMSGKTLNDLNAVDGSLLRFSWYHSHFIKILKSWQLF